MARFPHRHVRDDAGRHRPYGPLVAALLGVMVAMGTVQPAAAAVLSCSSSTPVASRPTLRAGDSGSCVVTLQRALIAKGYSVGSAGADGTFGSGTALGVRRFQLDHVALKIDAVVGQSTWGVLVNGGTKYNRSSGPNLTNRVILTYDDCPTSYAAFESAVVGARRAGVALALFPTGNCLSTGRFSASVARANGHYVFNHSVSHPDLTTLSYSSVLYQLGAPGVVTNYGRPPYGAYNSRVLNGYAAKSMRPWLWNVDTEDWRGKSQATVVSYVVNNAKPGNTVLMHMPWKAFNTSAITQMRDGLAARGIGMCRNSGTATSQYPAVSC
jgi:peptidoglycan hydrolase-like protein with peptidoglycan-binding domain